jgi:hypothetical protein
MYVAFWAGQLHLFPIPSGVYTLKARAYRHPNDWVTAGGTVDGPYEFDLPLVYYAVSQIYRAQEAPQMAAEYERAFNDGVLIARRDIMKPESYAPLRLSTGGHKHRWGSLDI